MTKQLSLEQAEEIARVATKRALEDYDVPASLTGQVDLTTLFEDDDRVFVLYVPGETRHDPMIVARAKVNLNSSDVSVEVPVLSKKTEIE